MTRRSKGHSGFTLIELTVVITIIVLLALTALPSIVGIFTSSSDSQAYNLVVAVLSSARSEAIQGGTYTCVHFQLGCMQKAQSSGAWTWVDSQGNWLRNPNGLYYATIFTRNPADGTWSLAGYPPQAMPGNIVFGEVNSTYASVNSVNASGSPAAQNAAPSFFDNFTTFNIIFAPNGSIVRLVNGAKIDLVTNYSGASPTPFVDPANPNNTRQQASEFLWNAPALITRPGATALTLFDYAAYEKSGFDPNFINKYGQLIGINVYTGQPFPRK